MFYPNLRQENLLFAKGLEAVAGLDEAGRGPLAGPVAAGCVVVRKGFKRTAHWRGLRDSKKLIARARQHFFALVEKNDYLDWSVGWVDNKKIDQINVSRAVKLAMRRALACLRRQPEYLLVDGRVVLDQGRQACFIRGDEHIFSVALASIMAKVSRDQLMIAMHKCYPHYSFAKHKGYGTPEHLQALKKYGACPLHRLSFHPLTD